MAIKSKRISTSFAVILIFLTIITAGFFYKFFTKAKYKPALVAEVVTHPHKKHKRKHKVKNLVAAITPKKHIIDTVKIARVIKLPAPVQVKPAIVKALPVVVIKPIPVRPKPDSIKMPKPTNNGFLYTTYVQPNVTGIVTMRDQDKFYSNTIARIPANSKVNVLAKGTTYYRVSYNNTIGFIPKWALQDK